MVSRFGYAYRTPIGFIASPCGGEYNHRFGGASWCADRAGYTDSPALIMVLDLSDSRLSSLQGMGVDEIPLFSYVNSDHWVARQDYTVLADKRKVTFTLCANPTGFVLSDEDKLPNPLPEVSLCLTEMSESDYPLDESSYWDATDEFLGGRRFIRILGKPLWLQEPEEIKCSCGIEKQHVASIGYENWDGPFLLLKDQPFFIGEAALYFFYCTACKSVSVISQSEG